MELFAKKSLGQHFLNSKHALDQIISAAALKTGECVLEIGPGTGILTQALIDSGAHVIAVEKDDRAFELLKVKFFQNVLNNQLELIHGDILESKIPNLKSPFKLVANIPYYITGAILEKFLEHGPQPELVLVLVQKEVAERIVARDGKESILSVSVKAFGTPKIVAIVPRGAFTPPPKVDSAILAIEAISDVHFKGKNIQPKQFFKIVRAGFAHKRKVLIRNLESVASPEQVNKAWSELKLDPKVRAEDLTAEQWLEIAARL
jgi:16S rRNA (adenine1518-N6/adenine1519-N6)-dimethyltransferase